MVLLHPAYIKAKHKCNSTPFTHSYSFISLIKGKKSMQEPMKIVDFVFLLTLLSIMHCPHKPTLKFTMVKFIPLFLQVFLMLLPTLVFSFVIVFLLLVVVILLVVLPIVLIVSRTIPGQVIRPVDPIVFDRIRVGFHRNPTSFIKNRSDPIEIIQIRQDSIPL